ncbi:GTPase HflX [Ktedonobacter sp. SOSP1-85]|uniref:GTPase HflX n=1 Tax=Ktedonobacter sp. SOSP1-85 TaxID=2778367 RepID=UPI001A20A066|nr:GTPase HflX [Ktedonobacter sp. SOSP1-85]GHO75606.1 GTPase HflX [Ktedonobacter sp. SOSP1-85]
MEDVTTHRLIDTGIRRGPERAYLVAVEADEQEGMWGAEDSLQELEALATTAGAAVLGRMIQHLPQPDAQTYLGKGKAQELVALDQQLQLDVIIFDDELTPTQQRSLDKMLNARVIDRTALILDVFAQRAYSHEGRLQVELAQAEYRLPRLAGSGTYTRQAGGSLGGGGVGGAIGVRGPGETRLELDRRRIRSRISALRKEIEEARSQRALQRKQRVAQGLPMVAVVGYTNAGKSTLFNALTEAGVLAEDKLFATLDPVTRRLLLPNNQEALLSDTVGFIQKLPTQLIAAFRATLEEVIEADLLLEVVDISHENAFEQSETVHDILEELGAAAKPRVTALNKIDLLTDPDVLDPSLYSHAVPISAAEGKGLEELCAEVASVLADTMEQLTVLLPFSRGDLVELFHRRGLIAYEEHEDEGTRLMGRLPRSLAGYYSPYIQPPA